MGMGVPGQRKLKQNSNAELANLITRGQHRLIVEDGRYS
jgi:hypothetical protein